jgi:hypothetical protein
MERAFSTNPQPSKFPWRLTRRCTWRLALEAPEHNHFRAVARSRDSYQIPYLQPGVYTLEVTHPGFKTHRRGPIELRVNDRAHCLRWDY